MLEVGEGLSTPEMGCADNSKCLWIIYEPEAEGTIVYRRSKSCSIIGSKWEMSGLFCYTGLDYLQPHRTCEHNHKMLMFPEEVKSNTVGPLLTNVSTYKLFRLKKVSTGKYWL